MTLSEALEKMQAPNIVRLTWHYMLKLHPENQALDQFKLCCDATIAAYYQPHSTFKNLLFLDYVDKYGEDPDTDKAVTLLTNESIQRLILAATITGINDLPDADFTPLPEKVTIADYLEHAKQFTEQVFHSAQKLLPKDSL